MRALSARRRGTTGGAGLFTALGGSFEANDVAHAAVSGAVIGWASLGMLALAMILPHHHSKGMSHATLIALGAGAAAANGGMLALMRRLGSTSRWVGLLLWAWAGSLLAFLALITYVAGGTASEAYVLSFPAVVFAATLLPPAAGVASGVIAAGLHTAAVLAAPAPVTTGDLALRIGALIATGIVGAELSQRVRREVARRSAAEAERELRETMLQELHHRVKNDLQTVAELFSLEAHREPRAAPDEVLDRTVTRIRSIVGVHDLVARSPGAADAGALVARVVRLLSARVPGDDVRIAVEGGGLSVRPEQATCLALVVNELVTNALAHAFPNGRPGTVTVTTARRENMGRVAVADDGVGMTAGDGSSDRLGLELVRRVVAGGLHGTFSLVSGSPGVVATVEFPVPALSERERAPAAG